MDRTYINLAEGAQTPADKARIKKDLLKKEQSPSSRGQSASYQYFQEQMEQLGTPYDVTRIPISVLEQMERDPMIRFGMHFTLMPIHRANWYIKCERPDIATFIDRSLRRIHSSYINQRSQCLTYGFAPMVKRFQLEQPNWTYLDPSKSDDELKVWDNGNVDAITWKTFVVLPSKPSICSPNWTNKGEFNGIRYYGGNLPIPFAFTVDVDKNTRQDSDGSKDIDVRHSLWSTNEQESSHGSLWGFPRIGYAYRYWWSYWFRWALYDRFFERKADPPYRVYYPTGSGADYSQEDDDSDPTSMKAHAIYLGEQARSGGVLALPGDLYTGFDDRPTNVRKWDIAEVEVKGDMTHFLESFEYLDVMKLRAIFIPEQALLEGKGGTSSRNVAEQEIGIHKESAADLSDEIDEEINRFMIPDLVAANFPDFDGDCEKITTGFAEADKDTQKTLLQTIGQNNPEALRQISIDDLLDDLGIKSISHKEMRRQEEEAEKALQEANPPVIDPDGAGNAGVTEEGFYVKGREVIRLADDTSFITNLPKSRHYEDKNILAKTRELRTAWRAAFSDIYEHFARYVSRLNSINLAEGDKADKVADRIVAGWRYTDQELNEMIKESVVTLDEIINRAGERELRRANLPTEFWKQNPDTVADYLKDRGVLLATAMQETTRDELQKFLAAAIRDGKTIEEMGSLVREHFDEFPDWKADRLARTEVHHAYNFATLEAGQQAGVKIVQFRDAQFGETDAECVSRNGEFMDIDKAFAEVLTEHPNGTLEVLLTKRENLSVKYVEEMPEGQEDKMAYFDSELNEVYLSNDIPDTIETQFLLQLGKVLEDED